MIVTSTREKKIVLVNFIKIKNDMLVGDKKKQQINYLNYKNLESIKMQMTTVKRVLRGHL